MQSHPILEVQGQERPVEGQTAEALLFGAKFQQKELEKLAGLGGVQLLPMQVSTGSLVPTAESWPARSANPLCRLFTGSLMR